MVILHPLHWNFLSDLIHQITTSRLHDFHNDEGALDELNGTPKECARHERRDIIVAFVIAGRQEVGRKLRGMKLQVDIKEI